MHSTTKKTPPVTVIEVRPGEGGDEAALFAREVLGVIAAWARRSGAAHTVDDTPGRTYTIRVDGDAAVARSLTGTHRIQREPPNGKGKRHTSTATVAALDGDVDVEVAVAYDDLDIQAFRSGGNGGQHAQKNQTAVRVTHRPTGVSVVCEAERSQARNIDTARAEIHARLTAAAQADAAAEANDKRRAQIADAGRPAKTFTWNAQRGEVVDHQTGRRWRLRDFTRGRIASG